MSLDQLKKLNIEYQHSKHPNFPKDYLFPYKYTDKTANGLTKCIIDWIRFNGGQAERVSTVGRYVQGASYVDVVGRTRLTKGKYIPSVGAIGASDISAIIKGKSLKIEVKMKDKESPAQLEYKKDVEAAGGIYFIAHNFNEFLVKYNEIINCA